MKEKIIVMGGSFNPPTIAHQRLLLAMAEDDERLSADDLEFTRKEKGYTYETMLQLQEGIESISSSAVRQLLRDNPAAAEAMCHPKAWKLMQENGGMEQPMLRCVQYECQFLEKDMSGCSVVRTFHNQFRFLSNFWDAPVTYRGLTYLNNEAAFQAQVSGVSTLKTREGNNHLGRILMKVRKELKEDV